MQKPAFAPAQILYKHSRTLQPCNPVTLQPCNPTTNLFNLLNILNLLNTSNSTLSLAFLSSYLHVLQ